MGPGPRLVVGMPVYNGENYLDDALRSLRMQTFTDFVIVITDNASTDSTPQIVKQHAEEDDRIVLVRHETNLGAAPNYNSAYHVAPLSDYFCWLAHDDRPMPQFFEKCVQALDDHHDVVLAFAGTEVIDHYGNELDRRPARPQLMSPYAHVRFADVIDQHHSNHPVFGVIRRTALDRTHLHGSYTGSDRVLVAELALLGPFAEVSDLLFAVREHPDRSVRARGGAHASGQSRDAWFDTKRTGRVGFPRWRRLRNYVAAIRAAPLPGPEKRRCRVALVRWLVVDGNWKALLFDVTAAAKQLTGRVKALRR